jgi:RHS repeat-associated protein
MTGAQTTGDEREPAALTPPVISLPKGGGAIRGIGEKFTANPVTGTGSLSVPLATSPGRAGFGPSLTIEYDSGAGNGPFGLGWGLSLPSITRKTEKGLPGYKSEPEDTFVLFHAEDLVPVLEEERAGQWHPVTARRTIGDREYSIQRYRPRIEGLFARIERWTDSATGETHWRSITPDNVTTLYGRTAESRIADPYDPARVFSWLICESYDDTGNTIVFEYKAENSDGVEPALANEANRTPRDRAANRYLKRVKYGNRASRLTQPDASKTEWLFEVVFDYGEHDRDAPRPEEAQAWSSRRDPFSSYRAGFEVRTYRLCQRVLMFHHFPEEEGVGVGCLVRSSDLAYRESPTASFLEAVVQHGYRRDGEGGYVRKSLPPLEFAYSEAVINEELQSVDSQSMENLPFGLDGSAYRWVDLDGEGVSGVLTEQADAWFYKPNIGEARFGPMQLLTTKPALAALSRGRQELLDLAGNGRLDLVEFDGPTPGFSKRSDNGWEAFRPFGSRPDIQWDDPDLHFADLSGDGLADVLIGEEGALIWYPSLGEEGFGPARRAYHPSDEAGAPQVRVADEDQAIYLTDMSGDGLSDLVRVRNGEVSYWPNLGHGRFGVRVTMDRAPWFDEPDQFDPRRLRTADIDGSGTTDIVYLHRQGVRIYFNRSGNSWSEPCNLVQAFPSIDSASQVTALDLRGNGTACLVWSSRLASEARRPLRYIDLMGGTKPHLLTSVRNNLGAETQIHYAPSTRFYLADKAAGRPWVTRLPFPVQVVERVEIVDRINRNRFVTQYAYHDGYFDGFEREFRGFGLVEQWDTESYTMLSDRGHAANVDSVTHVPPVLTRTWFHTGAFTEAEHVSRHFAHEYWSEHQHCTAHPDELLLEDTILPSTVRRPGRDRLVWRLSPHELREAHRALKGSLLRQEVYALDGSEAAGRPYTVSERNYTIEMLQPAACRHPDVTAPQHAVLFVHPRETLAAHYERKLYSVAGTLRADPLVNHELVLEVDDYGNVLRSVAIAYGRRHAERDPTFTSADRKRQLRTHLIATEKRYTNPVEEPDDYRSPQLCESQAFELLGLQPDRRRPGSTNLFDFAELARKLDELGDGRHDVPYERWDAEPGSLGTPARRAVEQVRTLYRRDDLTGPLPLGRLEPRALPFESYRLAFTPSLLVDLYCERADERLLTEAGGYVHEAGHAGWWVPSGRVFYSPTEDDHPAAELAHARRHFFTPSRFRNPFGGVTTITYDRYDLLSQQMRDAVGNLITAGERAPDDGLVANGNDYRVLQPRLVMDANRNRAAVAFDTLGMLVGTAVMGKPEEELGDSLAGFEPDPSEAIVAKYMRDPLANPHSLLQSATTRLVYDLFAYRRTCSEDQPQPPLVATLARDTHVADLLEDQPTRVQHTFSYSDGFGREIQKKTQAEPGRLEKGGALIDRRWVGSGWTIFNNKGRPVRRYEPFFSAGHSFEYGRVAGVSTVLFYDPVERVVATLHPNDTWEKVSFDPWLQVSWDANDTVLLDPRTDADVGGFVAPHIAVLNAQPGGWHTWYERRAAGELGTDEQSAAEKAAVHAGTPARAWFDALGHRFLTAAHNRMVRDGVNVDETYATRIAFDVEGNQRTIEDANGRRVMRYGYSMLGDALYQASMESGTRWVLNDVGGSPISTWNSRGFRIRHEYDDLRRPLRQWVGDGTREFLAERTVYGEMCRDAAVRNLRGKSYCQFDGAGAIRHDEYDFKGNLLRSTRRLTREYGERVKWAPLETLLRSRPLDVDALETALEPLLEDDSYSGGTTYDAHNRPTTLLSPDGSMFRLAYNDANLLERLDVHLRGAKDPAPFVTGVDYNARGQRLSISYGNGVIIYSNYDPQTFRLTSLRTLRGGTALQDFRYVYDPVGNVTKVEDGAQQTVYFRNAVVPATARYVYDALYQLVSAEGREHVAHGEVPQQTWDDATRTRLAHPGDGQAMRRYRERYAYDPVGNLLEITHGTADGGWSRAYAYAEPSALEPDKHSNRLSRTSVGNSSEEYRYDSHGNVTTMPHLREFEWDHEDQLRTVDLGGGGRAWYQYDTAGRRVRKVIERQNGTRHKERIYVGGYEVFRTYRGDGTALQLERQTLRVLDDQQLVALIETKTADANASARPSPSRTRYQFADHLGSVALELDDAGRILSYEEFYPYGGTSYQAGRASVETGQKRYRYTGKERDEETGLYYYGARYYASWLGRWISCDPAGLVDGSNTYRYVKNNPVNATDPTGMWEWPSWRTVAVVAAVVVVGTVATVATAGAAGPLVAGAVASVGLTGTAATVTTSVAVGVVAGAVGGGAAAAAGETTRQAVNSRALGLGNEEFSGGRIVSAAGEGAASGAVIGGAVGGAAALATTATGAAAIGAVGRTAQRVVPAGIRSVATSAVRSVAAGVRAVARVTGLQALSEASEGVGVRVAQGVFREGSAGAQAAQRFAQTGSVAKTFGAEPAPPAAPPAPPPQAPPVEAPAPQALASPPLPQAPPAAAATATSPQPATRPARVVAPAPPAAPGEAGPPTAAPPRFRIGEGVRRAVAARELGQPDIAAVDTATRQSLGRIPLDELLSPKAAIPRDPRFQAVLRGLGGGNPPGMQPPPPIEVTRLPPGVTGGPNLTPLPNVTLLRWRGP